MHTDLEKTIASIEKVFDQFDVGFKLEQKITQERFLSLSLGGACVCLSGSALSLLCYVHTLSLHLTVVKAEPRPGGGASVRRPDQSGHGVRPPVQVLPELRRGHPKTGASFAPQHQSSLLYICSSSCRLTFTLRAEAAEVVPAVRGGESLQCDAQQIFGPHRSFAAPPRQSLPRR